MASALNKRQQARNERALQELIKTVPGNGTCADCGARNPGWASWSLGIFLCMRCAALHRKLGTHISKVKSLSMDKWDNAQVDNMKRIGNIESNRIYTPRNNKAQTPIDVDEVDSAMERYIRQKYEQRAYMNDPRLGTQQNTGSTSSDDRPPPLPPKPSGRFGFGLRKSSNTPRDLTPPVSPGIGGFGQETSPPRVNKPSRVFGSNIHTSGDGLDSKLATLRDMGFPDDKRNSTVLKGLNGNLDRTVEALIRLGEQNTGKSRGSTPTPSTKSGTNGLSFDNAQTTTAPTTSMNPFDALDAAAPPLQQQPSHQFSQSQAQQQMYGNSSAQPTPSNSYNPFLSQAQQGQYQQQSFAQQSQPQQQQQQQQQQQYNYNYQQQPQVQQHQGIDQVFQNLQLSHEQPQQLQQTQQPLFPNRTGGHGQPQAPQYSQTNPFQQSFTPPPMPQIPEQYSSFFPSQPQYQPMSSPTSPGNPFLKSSRSQTFTPMSLNSNPFGQPPAQQQVPQQYQQQQYVAQQQATQQQQHQQQQASNPFMMQQQTQTPTAQAPNPWQNQQQTYQQPNYQPSGPQQTANPFDKSSILALYNYPQLAPQPPERSQTLPSPAPVSAPQAREFLSMVNRFLRRKHKGSDM
ncbi:ArfGap-domain-containing protein [Dothidotthia symphoricarpi CBS 119687]|uniref:ArfGap-domain-containing protein n=1 Tax=Dothidotthia symphoricarpi CBS 119687 TaxID=1392245 RepID=A0A6A6AT01_9PLEO|nr:ArfGap-domain-containing protein [Dothidotthia symphoricarpi CBS 119687]KAF2133977.1 ArfGap-domain-containing protein [Dothidotthia symphoricarpi CBS 119687]